MCRRNFIGNGSAGMIRRRAFEDVGGCDEALRGDLAGYTDAQLYLKLAERYQFAVVPELLVGYRLVTGSMVDNHRRMMRAYRTVTAPFKRKSSSNGFAAGRYFAAITPGLRLRCESSRDSTSYSPPTLRLSSSSALF